LLCSPFAKKRREKGQREWENGQSICVSEEKIVEIPISKIKNGVMEKPELANQTLLMMQLVDETENRKPYKILHISFENVSFAENGKYD